MMGLRVLALSFLFAIADAQHRERQLALALKGVNYLLEQQNPTTLKFPRQTNAPAILGLLAWDPFVFENETETSMELRRQHVATDFLYSLNELGSLRPDRLGDSPITLMDDATLMEYFGALHGLCVDQTDFYGYNIIEEIQRRVAEHTNDTVNHGLYGGLVLALCNAEERLSRKQIRELGVLANPDSLFQAEEDALKLLGALCISEKRSDRGLSTEHLDDVVVPRLVDSLVNIDSDASFMALALTLQSLIRAPSVLVETETRIDFLGKLLGKMQSEDGSFGFSIALTSLAIPAFTGHTASDFRQVPCKAIKVTEGEDINVPFSIIDNVVSHQHTRGMIPAKKGGSLPRTLNEAFHPQTNKVLRFYLARKNGISLVVRINNLGRRLGQWKVYRRDGHGKRIDVTRKLSVEKLKDGFTYEFIFDKLY